MEFLKKRKWILIGAAVMICVGAAAAIGMNRKPTNESAAAAKAATTAAADDVKVVTVDSVVARRIQRRVSVVGSLYGQEELTIGVKVEGRVIKVHKDLGDVVKPGDVLVEIDPTDFKLAVDENQRSLELELAKLGLKKIPGPEFNVKSLPAAVRAEAMLENALSKRDRMRKAVNASSDDERERAETEWTIADANYKQTIIEGEAIFAAVRYRASALDTAKQRLADTRVVVPKPTNLTRIGAPAAEEFVVAQRLVTEGEMARPLGTGANSLFRLVIDNPLKLKANVPERFLSEVVQGQKAEIQVESWPDEKFIGTVARVSPTVDRSSRTFAIEVSVPNDKRRLSAGSFAQASVLTRADDSAITVPEEAIIRFAGVTKIFIVVDGKSKEIQVRTGERLGIAGPKGTKQWIEVIGDVPADARVVITGQGPLADGTPVRIRETAK